MVVDGLRAAAVRPLLAVDREAPTGIVVATPEGIVADRGANAFLAPADIPSRLHADAVLVSGYALLHEDSAAAAVEALGRSAGRWCAVDAASAALVAHCGAERFFALSGEANAVLATEEEARELTGRTGAAEAAALLAERYSLACVKRGPAGALAVLDGRVEEAAAPAVAGEALGAGDVFAATLLVGLARGDGLRAALSAACDAAARAAAS